ncbi:MAG: metallophosphoesterase [Candidatus Dormibacteraeota bacterium]|nr:metallophosphoesterase [Candidatus Dormibacteraeota bacterium]
MRLAAVGDVHFAADSRGRLRGRLEAADPAPDLVLLAGDLTRRGSREEAEVLADELRSFPVPVVAVLGNHDYHLDQEAAIREVLGQAGIQVLEGEATVLQVRGVTLAVAGVKGFGGGFAGACATEFGEREMKAFVRTTRAAADAFRGALDAVRDASVRIALLHYSPVEQTLAGERLPLWPFLGSYLLGEAMDAGRAHLGFHGHAHAGSLHGVTAGGVPVFNVAQPLLGEPFLSLAVDEEGAVAATAGTALSDGRRG